MTERESERQKYREREWKRIRTCKRERLRMIEQELERKNKRKVLWDRETNKEWVDRDIE